MFIEILKTLIQSRVAFKILYYLYPHQPMPLLAQLTNLYQPQVGKAKGC